MSKQQDKADADLVMELWGSPERWNARKSYADVARKLGVDEETVRNRLRRMRESGHLLGWCLFPNPALLGRTAVSLLLEFDASSSKEDAILRLKQVEGVTNIASNYGNSLEVMVFDDGEGVSSQRSREDWRPREGSESTQHEVPTYVLSDDAHRLADSQADVEERRKEGIGGGCAAQDIAKVGEEEARCDDGLFGDLRSSDGRPEKVKRGVLQADHRDQGWEEIGGGQPCSPRG